MHTRYLTCLTNLIATAILACVPALTQTVPVTESNGILNKNNRHDHERVTEGDDAFHYKYWEPTPYSAAYTEWWYFNLYDERKDLQAIFSYQVIDPQNLSGHGISFVTAVAFAGGKIVNSYEQYPLSAFSPSYSSANLTMGADTISVLDQDTYRIDGATIDGRITWDLLYDRESDSWFAADRVHVAPAPWEQMSWLLYMPRAHVSGTVIVDGQPYAVDSSGYHDHNWGEWDFSTVRWNWAEYSNRDLAFDLGDFIDNPNGRATVDVAEHRTVFTANQYKLVHTKWAYDPQNKTTYPIEGVLTADNGAVQLSVKMNVQKTDPLPSIPGLVIYEQPTHFTGTVTTCGVDSESRISVEGNGFREYTAISNSAAQ